MGKRSGGNPHAIALVQGVTYRDVLTAIDPPGSIFTFCFGQSERSSIIGSFVDSGGKGHAFLEQLGAFTQLDFPGAVSTDGNDINAAGTIIGDFFDSAGVEHGCILPARP